MKVYALGGVMCAIGAIIYIARIGSMDFANAGSGYEMDAIAAVVVGGTSMAGGKGSLVGAFVGMLIIGVMNNILNTVGVPTFLCEAVKGLIIIFAVLLQNAICVYELSGGAMGTMTASWTYYGAEDNSTILYGTKGIMRIYDDPAAAIKVILTDGSKISYDVEAIQTNDNQTKSGVIDLWMDSLVNNREPEISGRSTLTAMRAVFASLRSSELGTAVEIPENR